MEYLVGYALIGGMTGAAACYVAPSEQKPLYFAVALLAWPIVALALLAEVWDERSPQQELPKPRTGWPRTRCKGYGLKTRWR